MAVDGHYRINEVVPRHFPQAAKAAGYGVTLAEEVLAEVCYKTDLALEATIKGLGANFSIHLAEPIADGIRSRTALIKMM